ncbi:hypothetical protein LINPERHAP1_LOCUS15335 [Linum perenne]
MASADYKWPREPGLEEEDGSSTPLENMPLVVGLRNSIDSGRSSSQTHIPSKLSPGVQLAAAQSMQTPKSKVLHKMDEDSTAASTYNESMNALKRKSGDIGWQYGTLADPMNKDKVKCNFCDKAAQLQQQRIDQALWQQRTLEVQQYIAKWVYTHVVSFNSIDNDEFKQIREAIGRFGPGLKPPTQYDIRETLLKLEYARTKSMLKDRDEEKMKNECSLMTDAWIDMKRRSIMNIVTHC